MSSPRPQGIGSIRRWLKVCAFVSVTVGCGGAPTIMGVHRQTLDDFARGRMDCPTEPLDVQDTTPADFRYAGDPDARRYDVRACDQTESFVCFRTPQSSVAETLPECRKLGERPPRVYLGPVPL